MIITFFKIITIHSPTNFGFFLTMYIYYSLNISKIFPHLCFSLYKDLCEKIRMKYYGYRCFSEIHLAI
jgi:hypothetical protein